MNRVTFEMLAKWMAQANNVKIVYDAQAKGAATNIKTKEIFMPMDLKEHNIFSALALLMHEAAHINHSQKIPDKLVKGHISQSILNVMEDIRIDNKNFYVLDNIRYFYERLVRDHVYTRKEELAKDNLITRCLINSVLENENFREIDDEEANKFSYKHNINNIIYQGQDAIEMGDWKVVKEKIEAIKKIFNITDQEDFEMPQFEVELVEGDEQGNKVNVDKYLKPGSAWDKGDGIKGPSVASVGETAFQDITKEEFKNLLNIKEKRIVYEGMKLNTDVLTDFFTGEIENMFIEPDIIKSKKSKIAFCLDASGSMSSKMMDKQKRNTVLAKTTTSIINILKELQELEGINISYDVWCFDSEVEKLDNDTWEKEYLKHGGGGTNLLEGFLVVQQDMLNNQEIEGNKIVILMTDGEVGSNEIDDLRNHIIKHGADVKCMVVGVGSPMNSAFVKNVVGENNIIAEEHADSILMECVRTMVE